jgi:drug/metabolite transporter (DMT)-like permease
MPKKSRLTLKILCFLISIDLLETVAQFCFKKSALGHVQSEISSLLGAIQFVQAVIPSVYLWVGLLSVIIIFIIWSTVLSRVDLSVAVPVCSFSYITVPLVSALFFQEKISILRWGGIGFILIGVILVSMSSVHKEEPR